MTKCGFPIDRDDLFCGKVIGEWSSLAPLGAPRPHQPSALGLVGAFFLLLTRMFHESLTTTTDMAVLPVRPRLSAPATYHSGTPRDQHPAGARWHGHLGGLVTPIHETSGFRTTRRSNTIEFSPNQE